MTAPAPCTRKEVESEASEGSLSPIFGGKSKVAKLIWKYLGDVDNYVECFCGSAAVLLARPTSPRIETVNDLDAYLANFWRSTQQAPQAVAEHCDWPVNEADLHARHRWLVLSDEAKMFRQRMRREPDYYDARVAGWWCWGLCCWIGSGWCQSPESVQRNSGATPAIQGTKGYGQGVVSLHGPPGGSGELSQQIPLLSGGTGKGVNANGPLGGSGERRPAIGHGHDGCSGLGVNAVSREGQLGHGVHAKGLGTGKRPALGRADSGTPEALPGVHGNVPDSHRPQLADAYSRGRGVHNDNHLADGRKPAPTDRICGNGVLAREDLGTCAQRRAWLLDWFCRLRDRLRTVRVCCGDWLRVCDSESVTTRLGVTGIFFDPPYGHGAGRSESIYSVDSLDVAADVRAYCLERGDNPKMRIVLAGYAGEGHEVLEQHGWSVIHWKASGGFGNRSEVGKANAKKERLWISPFCQKDKGLFDELA